MEEWKMYNALVLVSNFGRVKSISRMVNCRNGKRRIVGKVLKTTVANGYSRVSTKINGKTYHFNVHRAVAELFILNSDPSRFNQVNHIDGDKTNPIASNLEWITQSQNQLHAYGTGLQKSKFKKMTQAHADVIKILRPYIALTNMEIGKLFNVDGGTIQNLYSRNDYE